MLNRITVIGRLTRDPELRTTSNGVAVATFTVAVDRQYKTQNGEKETDFIPVVVWRGLAETCSKYLSKGNMVAIDGRLQIRNYENDKGERRTIAEIVAENAQFLTPKANTREDSNSASFDHNLDEPDEMKPLDDIPF